MVVRRVTVLLALVAVACSPARLAGRVVDRPLRVPIVGSPSVPFEDITVTTEDGLRLEGWLFTTPSPRGLVVLVHGKDINRQHFLHAAGRFQSLGYAVLAYDQRAHGRSEGTFVTYGVRESVDLSRAIDAALTSQTRDAGKQLPVIVIGESLGAAVALQAAAKDCRIKAVVAGAAFSDARTIISEKTPGILPVSIKEGALAAAQEEASFSVDEASPVAAAARIEVPVLVLHGSDDTFIPFAHSLRIYEALRGPKRLIRLNGVGHVDVLLHNEVWVAIESFVIGVTI